MSKAKKTRRPRGTGSVIQRNDRGGAFYCRWKRAHRSDLSRRVRSEHHGNRVLAKVEELLEDGYGLEDAVRSALGEPEARDGLLTFGGLTERYLAHLEANGLRSPANLAAERSKAKQITGKGIGAVYPADLTRSVAARWADEVLEGRSGKTVNRCLSIASKAWRFGQDRGHAPEGRNPFRELTRHPETPVGKVALTRAELGHLLANAERGFSDFATAAAYLCSRFGTVAALERRDLDLEALTLTIRGSTDKTRKARVVPIIAPELEAVLRRRTADPGLPTARLFTRSDGKAWTHKTASRRLRDALAACAKTEDREELIPEHKRTGFSFHGFKATGCGAYVEAGVPLALVGSIAGTDLRTLERHYPRAAESGRWDAARKLMGM